MRILFVTPYPPSPIRVRSFGFVQQLQRHHAVHVVTSCTGQRERADVEALQRQGITITAIHDPLPIKVLRGAAAYGTAQPLQTAFGASLRVYAALWSCLAAVRFDCLHIESVRALGRLPAPPALLPIPCVWDAVDCISELYAQGAEYGATLLMRLVGQHEAQRLRAYERTYLHSFRHVLVTARRDREALLRVAHEEAPTPRAVARAALPECGPLAQISVLPHGVDQSDCPPSAEPRRLDTLVFSGKMSFHANIAAVMHLVREIMPLIWQHKPLARLIIAGSDPPASIRHLALDRGIEVTEYLPDLRPAIACAQVAVCPLPYAVGIQNKVLEAMALGTPVVASSCVAAGLQASVGHDLLIADAPYAFAAAVLKLLDDQTLWHKLSLRGKAYVAHYHSWDTISRQLEAVYSRAIEDARARKGGVS